MSALYTKEDLRKIYNGLQRTLPPGGRPLNADEIVEVNALLDKTREMIAIAATTKERGRKVLEWRLPNLQAPTLNQYAFMKGWQKTNLRKELDEALLKVLPAWPLAPMRGARIRRWVRVTRFSTQRVDDLSVDVLGGKMPLDSLKRCEVIADDNDEFLQREPCWAVTKRGNTHVLIEVFECANEAVPCGPPIDAPVVQIVRKRKGKMTKAITGDTSE